MLLNEILVELWTTYINAELTEQIAKALDWFSFALLMLLIFSPFLVLYLAIRSARGFSRRY